MSYFVRTGELEYKATEHTGGAWNTQEQHIAPALGLMAHVLEKHRQAEAPGLQPARLSYDILGTLPIGAVSLQAETVRSGRTVQLVEVTLSSAGRPAARLRAWLMAQFDTTSVQETTLEPIADRESMQPWGATEVWPGGFIASLDGRRRPLGPGQAQAWLRTEHPLVAEEEVSDFARFCGLLDTANGVAPRAEPTQVAFPNLDLTISFLRMPQAGWVGYDTSVSFGPTGMGVTHSVVHDAEGPVGVMSQSLTVRPMQA